MVVVVYPIVFLGGAYENLRIGIGEEIRAYENLRRRNSWFRVYLYSSTYRRAGREQQFYSKIAWQDGNSSYIRTGRAVLVQFLML
jgi:hypothetical protein